MKVGGLIADLLDGEVPPSQHLGIDVDSRVEPTDLRSLGIEGTRIDHQFRAPTPQKQHAGKGSVKVSSHGVIFSILPIVFARPQLTTSQRDSENLVFDD